MKKTVTIIAVVFSLAFVLFTCSCAKKRSPDDVYSDRMSFLQAEDADFLIGPFVLPRKLAYRAYKASIHPSHE